uniref:MATH domain-containing protein n=1 Tax=Cannabis sativa TaxID=3483 RepID=A0A803PXL5_CANSA
MDTEISRCMRNVPPSHYLMKVKSFSLLSKSKEKHGSSYKWRLSFYPNGDKRLITDNNYISLYLTICETETLPNGWEVNVNFSLFIYNHLHDNYLTLQATRRFHKIKKEWGFHKIESVESFKNVSNGYLHNDCCVFGAEVFIIDPTPSFETLSVFERGDISNPIFRWEIKEFSKIMDKDSYSSEEFSSGGANWYLMIFPNGDESTDGKSLGVFLMIVDDDSFLNNSTVYAEYSLRVIDKVNSKHKKRSVLRDCFRCGKGGWGFPNFILLENLHKSSNGYVVNDTLIVEVEFYLVSQTKVSPKPTGN